MYREPKDSVIVNRGSLAPNLTDMPEFPLPGTNLNDHKIIACLYPHTWKCTQIHHHVPIYKTITQICRNIASRKSVFCLCYITLVMVYYVITLLVHLLLEIVISMPLSKTEVTVGVFKELVKNMSVPICQIPPSFLDRECIIVINYDLIKTRMSITVSSDKKLL